MKETDTVPFEAIPAKATSENEVFNTSTLSPSPSLLTIAGVCSVILAAVGAYWRRVRAPSPEEYVPFAADPHNSQLAMAAVSGKKQQDVVISPSYNLAAGTAGLAALLAALPGSGVADVPAGIAALLATLFGVQAGRVKFCFDSQALELKIGDDLENSGENIVVGGANRWAYRSFVNWDIFPNRQFPILVYFKENQTPEEKWAEGPGALDKVGGGQLHFFPAVCNVEEICEQFESRGCAKVR
jgi:NIMA (never in mitosis gene a)-related kinase